jgi:hypothetical protein
MREWRYSSTILDLGLGGGEWSVSHPGRFTPKERAHGTQWIGDWVGPRAGSDAVEKREASCPCRESNPGRNPLAGCYTDCTIPSFFNDALTYFVLVVHRTEAVFLTVALRMWLAFQRFHKETTTVMKPQNTFSKHFLML